jgi:uncharacterized protein involved in exopolysaccharide biosynthesis
MDGTNNRNLEGEIRKDPTLRDLLTPLFRKKRLFGFSFLLLLVGTVISAFLLSSEYKSTMGILVNRERLDPMVTAQATNQTPISPPPVTEEEINSEVELIRSPELLKEVVLANGLQDVEKKNLTALLGPTRKPEWYVAKAVKAVRQKLNIEVVRKTNVISVDYKANDPEVAYGVLNKLAGLYMQKHLAVHRPQGSYDFFAKEAEKYNQALRDSETQLASFGSQEQMAAPDVQRTSMAQELVGFDAALHNAEQGIAASEERIKEDRAQMTATPQRAPTLEVSSTPDLLLQQLGTSLLAAQLKRTQLGMKYDPSYPVVQEADQELVQTQAAFAEAQRTKFLNQTTDRDSAYELLRLDLAKTQADLASQHATARALKDSIRSTNTQIVRLDHVALKQSDLLRQVKANEDNYLLYLSKREQEHTSDALDQKRIGNVAIAVLPELPVLPAYSFIRITMLGFLIALFASVAVAYAADYLSSSIRTPSEVNDILGIPALASFPKRAA